MFYLLHLIFVVLRSLVNVSMCAYRTSHRRCSINIGALKNFSKFTGKHLCWSLLLPVTLLKRILQYRRFPVSFTKLLKTPFSQSTSGGLLLYLDLLSLAPILRETLVLHCSTTTQKMKFSILEFIST